MQRTSGIILVLGVLALAADMPVSYSAETTALGAAARCVARPEILVIAHRGDSKVAPENTLPAFASAVKAGADLVELDYYHSADGVPVVFHDAELDRTTNAGRLWGGEKIKIHSKSLAELKLLDAGSWFESKFAGTRIPTLDEALDTIQAGSLTLVERKGGEPATCIELLKQKKLLDQVVVQAFDWDYLAGCHQIAPDLVLAALGDKECTAEKLDQIAQTGARIVGWEDKFTNDQSIAAIHARGWKAWVWTVDDPQRIEQLVTAKIDGIITNRPALARRTINAALGAR
jgi:glycerophosphoryl diester phosphodiesterase